MIETSQESIQELKAQLDHTLEIGIPQDWGKATEDRFPEQFTQQGRRILETILEFGDQYFNWWEQNNAPSAEERQKAFFATYYWPECAKGFLILWRDILFEIQKGRSLLQLEVITVEELDGLTARAKATVEEAARELSQFLEKRLQQARKQKGGIDKEVRQLRLQTNPWLVYRKQFLEILGQLENLSAVFQELSQTSDIFQSIRDVLNDTVSVCWKKLTEHRQIAQRLIDQITQGSESKPGKIANLLEDREAEIQLANHIGHFSETVERQMTLLSEKLRVPISTEGGVIKYKELNFRRSTQQWLDSEVIPLLYEIWELTELNTNGFKMSLLNIRNRALVLASENKDGKNIEFDRKDLVYPLQTFIRKSDATEQDIKKFKEMVDTRMEKEFQLTHIYHPTKSFLPVPLQSTINKLKVNQNVIVANIQAWAEKQSRALSRFRKTVELEESLSISEKVVRYLQSRNWEIDNSHYHNLFLTKGYIGESFWVGRKDELGQLDRLISDWRGGYRGAVALTGQRLSGKSLMGELVSHRHFSQKNIRLLPQSSITIEGRRMATTYDLEEALSFIRKHTLNKPYLVWIDDLELWRDPTISLGKNMYTLRRYIDDFSNQLFFLVSMGNTLRHQLDRFFDIMKVFQAEINLDWMPIQDIREAIMIRHGATHKELLDSKGREVSPQQFKQMTAKVHKAAHGNVGEALNIWAFSIQAVDEERVMHQLKTLYELPDFIHPDYAFLLAGILLAKKTNEYRLRKLFGPAFSDKYRGNLQRLISIGLLRRSADGWLEITECATNDLGRLLERRNYLKFQR